MANMQPMKMEQENEKPVDISGASTKSELVAESGRKESPTSSKSTPATMLKDLPKIWKSAELLEFRQRIGLVAGALSDLQAKGCLVAVSNVEFEPGQFGVRLYLVADGLSIKSTATRDGLDFEVVPSGSKTGG